MTEKKKFKKIKKKIKKIKKIKRRVRQANQQYRETKKIEIIYKFVMPPYQDRRPQKLNIIPAAVHHLFHRKRSENNEGAQEPPEPPDDRVPKRPRTRGPEDDHPPPIKRPHLPAYHFL